MNITDAAVCKLLHEQRLAKDPSAQVPTDAQIYNVLKRLKHSGLLEQGPDSTRYRLPVPSVMKFLLQTPLVPKYEPVVQQFAGGHAIQSA